VRRQGFTLVYSSFKKSHREGMRRERDTQQMGFGVYPLCSVKD